MNGPRSAPKPRWYWYVHCSPVHFHEEFVSGWQLVAVRNGWVTSVKTNRPVPIKNALTLGYYRGPVTDPRRAGQPSDWPMTSPPDDV